MDKQDRQELSNVHKELGYLTAKVEDLSEDVVSLKDVCSQLRDTLQNIRDDISFAKASLRVVKMIGIGLVALTAFNYKAFFVMVKGVF